MPRYERTVVIECDTEEQAEIVLAERLGHDEDYGFEYQIGWGQPKSIWVCQRHLSHTLAGRCVHCGCGRHVSISGVS